jgi:pSer/pThr/pTyr-binding forkhead associated (FHA) protein
VTGDVADALPPCPACGTLPTDGAARYCAACGARRGGESEATAGSTAPRGVLQIGIPRLSLLDAAGDISRVIPLESTRATLSADGLGLQVTSSLIGGDGAALSLHETGLRIEPVGSPQALFVFLTEEASLTDGDVLLLGSQVIRYRRIVEDGSTYFADHGSIQVGSALPGADVAVLEQLRGDGRSRDALHLWAGRSILIGREEGDWTFPYDRTMSARHAVVSCGATGGVTVRDLGSRNGVAVAVRGPRDLVHGQRVSLGGQVMRVDLA